MAAAELQRFLVDALGGALEHGFAVPDDVLKHVTPDVLAEHLPRPLWAKLIAACLAAPKVDARLVVDTVGVVDLCANIPAPVIWQVVVDVATRALGKGLLASPPPAEKSHLVAGASSSSSAAPTPTPTPTPVAATKSSPIAATKSAPIVSRPATNPGVAIPPKPTSATTPATGVPITPVAAAAAGSGRATTVTTTQPSAPAAAVDIFFDDDDDEPAPLDAPPVSPHRAQTTPGPAARTSTSTSTSTSTGNGRPPVGAGASSRRPQATATGSAPRTKPRTMPPSGRRGAPTNSDFDLDTDVGTNEKADALPVDDDQLVDWSASEETVTSGHELDRKR